MINEALTDTFNELYEEFYTPVLYWFSKSVSYMEAEDLTQQTFIKLWSYLPCQSYIKSEKSLVFKIAKSVRADYFKKKSLLNQAVYITDDFELCDNTEFEKAVELQLIIESLSDNDKMLIEMKKQGFHSREIGKVLNLSASAVRTRQQVLRKKLAEEIEKM